MVQYSTTINKLAARVGQCSVGTPSPHTGICPPSETTKEMRRKDPGGESGRRRGSNGRREKSNEAKGILVLIICIIFAQLCRSLTEWDISQVLHLPTNLPGRPRSHCSMQSHDNGGCIIERLCSKKVTEPGTRSTGRRYTGGVTL